jgi:lysophospholipase L1-like esterase
MNDIEEILYKTTLKPDKYDFNISHQSKLMFFGSCFTENIGNKLLENKFNVIINPFGILYNPISIANSIKYIINKKEFIKDDFFYSNGLWNSFDFHSRFSEIEPNAMIKKINDDVNSANVFLKDLNVLFITFGTSWIYNLNETNKTVANCHKLPSALFNKKILNIEEIYKVYFDLISELRTYNKNLKIIFTISPVRHLKDGFKENNLSKSILRVATEQLINQFDNCFYFPAFELMTDDLRDYRFYNDDLIHPSESAVNYIFYFFAHSFFNEHTFETYNSIKNIVKSLKHKPFNTFSEDYFTFIAKLNERISNLSQTYKYLDFEPELEFCISILNKKSDI